MLFWRLMVLCETKETKWYFAKWYFAKWYFAKWYFAKWYFAKWYFAKSSNNNKMITILNYTNCIIISYTKRLLTEREVKCLFLISFYTKFLTVRTARSDILYFSIQNKQASLINHINTLACGPSKCIYVHIIRTGVQNVAEWDSDFEQWYVQNLFNRRENIFPKNFQFEFHY